MPDTQVAPIGEDGLFTRVEELIRIEDEGRRRILTKDGRLLCDIYTFEQVPAEPEAVPLPVPTEPGRVCEFDISHRFGYKHSSSELHSVRNVVTTLAEDLGRPLNIIDTFGWSGEVAMALCRCESSDIVTIVDDLSGEDRELEPWPDHKQHREALLENLGVLWESRINFAESKALNLTKTVVDEFDLVFIDTVASVGRMTDLIDAWCPFLSADGLFMGTSVLFKRMVTAIGESLGLEVHPGVVCVMSKRLFEAWQATQEDEVLV